MIEALLERAAGLRVLALGAHADDIEIGAGGTILRFAEAGAAFDWVVFSGHGERLHEARTSAAAFCADTCLRSTSVEAFRDGFFPSQAAEIKEHFETLKGHLQPDIVLTHGRDDRHQDHRLISDLTWNTFRDALILEYEIPKYDGDLGAPNLFVPVPPQHADRKIALLHEHFPSQRARLVRRRNVSCVAPPARPGMPFREPLRGGVLRAQARPFARPRGLRAGARVRGPCHQRKREALMKVLVTGDLGYLGTVMTPLITAAGHEIVGFGSEPLPAVSELRKDLRDVTVEDLRGFDAVIHLAALSNDPLGNINPDLTYATNLHASLRLAHAAKAAGVPRFIYSSSCSVYGASGDALLDEGASFNPVTPYGESKVGVEAEVVQLADDSFSPTFMRNATAYGPSPRLRLDLVVNSLVATAYTAGEVLVESDGTAWRPLVHAEDIARAFLAVLEAPREKVHKEAFNVGRTEENYQVRDVAAIVADIVPGSHVTYKPGGGPDARCYRADFGKIRRHLPAFEPRWTVRDGVDQLYNAYREHGLSTADLEGDRFVRLRRIRSQIDAGRLDDSLRAAPVHA